MPTKNYIQDRYARFHANCCALLTEALGAVRNFAPDAETEACIAERTLLIIAVLFNTHTRTQDLASNAFNYILPFAITDDDDGAESCSQKENHGVPKAAK